MRRLLVLFALTAVACGSSNPMAPSPTPTTAPVVPPSLPVPALAWPPSDPRFSQAFWNEFVHDATDGYNVPLRRLTRNPMLYLRTVDDAGVAIDPVTLSSVQTAMQSVAATWGGGVVTLAGLERGTDAHDGQPGWITVHFLGTNAGAFCGKSDVGVDGGVIQLNYHAQGTSCACAGGINVSPHVAKHELGHAFGYWHTDRVDDLMDPTVATCDGNPSAREIYHATVAYQQPVGSTNALGRLVQVID